MNNSSQNEEEKSKKPILLILLLCIIMIVAGLITGFLLSNYLNTDAIRSYDDNAEDIRDEQSCSEEFAENIAIPCWDTMVMTAEQIEQEVNFYNPEKNNGCDFQLTLLLDDGTELWKSQLISNGKAIYSINLNQPLEAGTYKAQIKYDCFTTNGNPLNGSVMNFNLIVKEGTSNE